MSTASSSSKSLQDSSNNATGDLFINSPTIIEHGNDASVGDVSTNSSNYATGDLFSDSPTKIEHVNDAPVGDVSTKRSLPPKKRLPPKLKLSFATSLISKNISNRTGFKQGATLPSTASLFTSTAKSIKAKHVHHYEPIHEPILCPRSSKRDDEDFYEYFLMTALSNAGKRAYGIVAIEVWILTAPENTNVSMTNLGDGKMLKCVTGGIWRDPVFTIDEEHAPLLSQLTDTSSNEYLPPVPVRPGLGLAGTLFDDEKNNPSRKANWRDLQQMVIDEDFKSSRLQALARVFGLAMGMYFNHKATESEGIVIYFARHSADVNRLSNRTNHKYLSSTTNMLGSLVSWKNPRALAAQRSHENATKSWKRASLKLLTKRILALSGQKQSPEIQESTTCDFGTIPSNIHKRIEQYFTKFKGGGFMIPPSMSSSRSIFAFLGCVSSLFTLSLVNEAIKDKTNAGLNITLGPLGALVTCHYGLTSAPATQPRNAVGGSVLSSVIGIASTYIPVSVLPKWLRIAIVPAVTITATLRLNLVHPPAGSMAVLFASAEEADWLGFLLLIFGYVMATMYASFFVNLHQGRRFPVYWGFPKIPKWC